MPDRVAAVREKFTSLKIDAFLISSLTNLRYLFGFTGSNGLAVILPGRIVFITDNRYRDQVRDEVKGADIFIAQASLFDELARSKALGQAKRVAFEAAHTSVASWQALTRKFPRLTFLATEKILEKITATRTAAELEHTRKACEIACAVWRELVPKIRTGISENDIAAEISYLGRRAGAESDAFEPIVASGWRSALPHGLASQKKLAAGEFVVVDFGFRYNGFCSDITRTVFLGEPDAQQRALYDAVLQANSLAREAARAGMRCAELDGVARTSLKKRGYEKEFSHSLGHGLGIDVHSMPGVGARSEDVLQPGNVITIEPGLYVPDYGGVRIEDDVHITEDGSELLTPLDRELICIA